jgi:hypothetical protein
VSPVLHDQHPIFDAVRLDLGVDLDAIRDRPRWSYPAAVARIEQDPAYKRAVRAAHKAIADGAAAEAPAPRRRSRPRKDRADGDGQ